MIHPPGRAVGKRTRLVRVFSFQEQSMKSKAKGKGKDGAAGAARQCGGGVMTPNDIEILIHCHVCPEPHPRKDAPAVQETLIQLETYGLIELIGDHRYRTTKRGEAHIEQLCNTLWPVAAWVNDRGEIILRECD